jgi:hypothetical protein
MPVAAKSSASLVDRIARPGSNPQTIATRLARTAGDLSPLLAGLHDSRARARYGCAKVLVLLSQSHPERVYPLWDAVEELMGDENKIMCWTAMKIIANLAPADSQGRIGGILPRLLAFIDGPVMITAANAIQAAAAIAIAKPDLAEKIVKGILRVEKANYQTEECRNIAIGHALAALRELGLSPRLAAAVAAFAQRQTSNPRNSTRRKALDLIAK